MAITPEVQIPACFICGSALRVALTHSKKGKVAVGLHCPADGRHLRAFVNHRPFVEEIVERAGQMALQGATSTHPSGALQNPRVAPSSSDTTDDVTGGAT